MFPEYDFAVTTLFDEQATRAALLVALHELVESDADNLFSTFQDTELRPRTEHTSALRTLSQTISGST